MIMNDTEMETEISSMIKMNNNNNGLNIVLIERGLFLWLMDMCYETLLRESSNKMNAKSLGNIPSSIG